MKMRRAWAIACACTLSACFGHLQPATVTFQGIPRPIMLSNVDRIGGGPPSQRQKLGEVEGEAVSLMAHSESRSQSGNVVTTTTTDTTIINNVDLYNSAIDGLNKDPGASIRITKLRPWARGYISFIKNTVYIEGDVVILGAP